MAGADNSTKVLGFFNILSIEIPQVGLACFNKSLSDILCAQNVVWGNAGLSRIDTLAPYDSPGSYIDIGIVRYYDRTLAP
jgi:hypothetical protein